MITVNTTPSWNDSREKSFFTLLNSSVVTPLLEALESCPVINWYRSSSSLSTRSSILKLKVGRFEVRVSENEFNLRWIVLQHLLLFHFRFIDFEFFWPKHFIPFLRRVTASSLCSCRFCLSSTLLIALLHCRFPEQSNAMKNQDLLRFKLFSTVLCRIFMLIMIYSSTTPIPMQLSHKGASCIISSVSSTFMSSVKTPNYSQCLPTSSPGNQYLSFHLQRQFLQLPSCPFDILIKLKWVKLKLLLFYVSDLSNSFMTNEILIVKTNLRSHVPISCNFSLAVS